MADSLGIPARQETGQTSVTGMSLRPVQYREEKLLANSSLRSFQDAEWGGGQETGLSGGGYDGAPGGY